LRILIINYEFPPLGGGAGNASYYIACELAKQGHEISVLTSGYKGLPASEIIKGVQILRIPVRRKHVDRCSIFEMCTFIFSALLNAHNIIRKVSPQKSLVFFGIPGGPVGLWLKVRYGIPYLLSLRGGDIPGFLPDQLRIYHSLTSLFSHMIWRNAASVCTNGEHLKQLAQEFEPGLKIESVSNGIDTGCFVPAKQNIRQKPSLIFAGRLTKQKGLESLLEALSIIHDARPGSGIHLYLVGDGPRRAELEELAKHHNIEKMIIFKGWVPKDSLPEIYNQGDIFILPSLDEGIPNAVLEAMACGLPVISTSVLRKEGIVEEGITGFLIPPADPRTLAERILYLYEDPEQIKKMGHAARRHVEKHFSWQKAASGFEKLLNA